MYRLTLPALLLALSVIIVGCGNDEPQPPKETVGGAIGKSYNQMLDQTRKGVDAANQRMEDRDQRARDTE